jgi:hypothetical protein
MGLISFTLFLVQSFETNVDEATLQAFEYSHIFIFSFAIVYVIQSAVLIASITPIQRRLIRLHAYGDAVAAAVATTTATISHTDGPGGWLGSRAARAFDGFRAYRKHFLSKHALTASFLFDHYLIGAWIGGVGASCVLLRPLTYADPSIDSRTYMHAHTQP